MFRPQTHFGVGPPSNGGRSKASLRTARNRLKLCSSRLKQVKSLAKRTAPALSRLSCPLRPFLKKTGTLQHQEAAAKEAANSAKQLAAQWIQQQQALPKDPPVLAADLSLDQLEQQQTQLNAQQADRKQRIQNVDVKHDQDKQLREEIPTLQLEVTAKHEQTNAELLSAAPENEPKLVQEARLAALRTKLRSLSAELSTYKQLTVRHEQEREHKTLPTHRELLTQELFLIEAQLATIQKRLTFERKKETETQLERAEREAAEAPPELAAFCQTSVNFAKKAHEILQPTHDAIKDQKAFAKQRESFAEQFKKAAERVENIGLSDSVGTLLRKLRSELPNETWLELDVRRRHAKVEDLRFEQYDLDDAWNDSVSSASQWLEKSTLSSSKKQQLGPAVEHALKRRNEYLESALNGHETYRTALFDLESTETALIADIKMYRDYINQRILWIRSNRLLFSQFELDESDRLIFSNRQWQQAGQALIVDATDSPQIYIALGLLVLLLALFRTRLRRAIERYGREAEQGSCRNFAPTARVTGYSLLMAMAVPLIPLILGWRFTSLGALDDNQSNCVIAGIGPALLALAWFFIPIELMRQICRRNGLAEKHFTWPDSAIVSLRNNLTWGIPLGAALTFIIALLYSTDEVHRIDLLERCLFLLAMGLMAYLLARILHPQNGLFADYIVRNGSSWTAHTRHVWYWLAVGVPIVLAVATVQGYYYTALQLSSSVYTTLVWLLGIGLIRAVLFRFILVRRRDAHIKSAQVRRAQQIEQQQSELAAQKIREQTAAQHQLQDGANACPQADDREETSTTSGSHQEAYVPASNDLDIDTSALQSSRLVSLMLSMIMLGGMWFIWGDVLPALRQLDEYAIWTSESTASMGAAATSMAGSPEQAMIESSTPKSIADVPDSTDSATVSARDLLLAILIALVTLITTRNVPSTLENHVPEPTASRSIRTSCHQSIDQLPDRICWDHHGLPGNFDWLDPSAMADDRTDIWFGIRNEGNLRQLRCWNHFAVRAAYPYRRCRDRR